MLIYPVEADVIFFLKSIIEALQPFAKAHSVSLNFESKAKQLKLNYHPESVAADLIQLLCRIITFTPQHQSVKLNARLVNDADNFYLKLVIHNTGVNLTQIREIVAKTQNTVTVNSESTFNTFFEIHWQLEKPFEFKDEEAAIIAHPPDYVRGFYTAVRDKMKQHFNKQQNRMAVLAAQNPNDAVFLQKVNAIIEARIADEKFDVEQLARALAIGRMQLHRKLKPLINQSPAHYIRDIRLTKAKKMIESENLSIGEICYKLGFQSQSHFTRVFIEKFGVRPTVYRNKK